MLYTIVESFRGEPCTSAASHDYHRKPQTNKTVADLRADRPEATIEGYNTM